MAAVAVTDGSAAGEIGVWKNVTPPGVTLDPNFSGPSQNFGAGPVLVDPVHPNELYAFFCYQGVWKSTDYGLTWVKVDTGKNSANLDGGRPFSAVIDDNPARDPATPPTLYTASGYGPLVGAYKSTDGGKNWEVYNAGDIYSYDIDPYDHQHLITGFHEGNNLAESIDGGVNWKVIPTDPANGKSIYPYFMDTGNAATTRKTWFLIPQVDSGTSTYTTDGGVTFKLSGGFSHPHGGNQMFKESANVAYAAGSGGVWRTQDAGAHWQALYSSTDGYFWANGVIGTRDFLYAWDDGSNLGGIGGPHLHVAPRNPGTNWTQMSAPPEMSNGPQKMAVTFDGTHYILVGGALNAGVWRYVEP
ncbi:MAG TPA: hypothetical protein VHL14_04245 [Steroidobacteraceae bacterium]|nr:hypothetical protein [Steroidobacteraceae bacterium]